MHMTKFYAGVGARKTPTDILNDMAEIASILAPTHILRSGHAPGADMAFETGCDSREGEKEIFLPFGGFNGHQAGDRTLIIPHFTVEAERLAKAYHPNWAACSTEDKLFLIRNGFQVLGRDLDSPVDFLICWTPNGSASGGTGQAIRIALGHHIPVFDLGQQDRAVELVEFLRERLNP